MKFIFDLDGTICFSGKPLSERIVQALDTLIEKGHEVIFASARPIRDLLPVLPAHMQHFSMVGGNGAFIAKGGEVISTIHFDAQTSGILLKLIEEFDAAYLIDSHWDYSYSGSDDHPIRRNVDPEQRAKNVTPSELDELVKIIILNSLNGEQLLDQLHKLPVVIYRHGQEDIIDISPKGINKWTGLQQLGVEMQRFIAFGNDANDIEMFRHSAYSVCVGEHTELGELATEKVSNEEEQIVRKILELMSGLQIA
ncbi:HAD family hydrolase [Paenibacillus sp. FSL K6-3166]|uniref:HAD-IIB family hydrolase n=1 Tax=unclassified Paenibacillus TaxID=185978 RepID=UPI000BA15796|nr:HAD family hydrolase [Paenibacillus sp. VTT E-133291]OZQ78824.1 HAD family hydrolase [Paenibacillus sp. VTT E-133291]